MANREQVSLLRKGASGWAAWRKKNRNAPLDLAGANLRGTDLFSIDLRGADLSKSDLSKSDLSCANLAHANFAGANLAESDLGGARLSGARFDQAKLNGAAFNKADLSNAWMVKADLSGADLSEANLTRANFSEAALDGVEFAEANLYRTLFAFTSLRTARGLETCRHHGPSALDLETLRASAPLPEAFLRGCGLAEDFIRSLPAFQRSRAGAGACLISYSRADMRFARRLHDALQERGLRCWLDEHPVLPSEAVPHPVGEAARAGEKVLLCCSHDSLNSWWVDKRVEAALQQEQELAGQPGRAALALIPLNLDGYLFRPEWRNWQQQPLTSRPVADFAGWDADPARFDAQLDSVVRALQGAEA